MQFQAKLGGVPWGISDMPLTDKPTSVIGYDVFHAKRKKSQLAFNSTVDRGFTRYWHTSIHQDFVYD